MVLVASILLLSLFLGSVGTAETKKETATVQPPAEIKCSTHNGTYVVFKANRDIEEMVIPGVCKKENIPSGWSVQCYTSDAKSAVDVVFQTGGGERHTRVVCS